MKKLFIIILLVILVQLKCVAQDINVAFTIDKNYPIFVEIVIFSILENNLSNNKYHFYILENNLTKKQKSDMKKFVEKRKQDISFIHIDTDKIDNGNNVYKYMDGRISRIGTARILLPEVLPNSVHRVLYLDGDVIVSDDLARLYNVNLKNNPVGMVVDYYSVTLYNRLNYYNSGVIVMDVDLWKKEKITDKMVTYFHENIDLFLGKKPMYYAPDQDLFNIVLKNRITTLPLRWNNLTQVSGESIDEQGINHYIGNIKPWHFPKSDAYDLYYEYWNNSPLKVYKYYYYAKHLNKSFSKYIKNFINSLRQFFSKHVS